MIRSVLLHDQQMVVRTFQKENRGIVKVRKIKQRQQQKLARFNNTNSCVLFVTAVFAVNREDCCLRALKGITCVGLISV